MGHLVNPIALRLSINLSWNSNWALVNKFNYNLLLKKDYFFSILLNSFISQKSFLFNSFFISNYKQYNLNNVIYINIYYYAPIFNELKLFNLGWNAFRYLYDDMEEYHILDSKINTEEVVWNSDFSDLTLTTILDNHFDLDYINIKRAYNQIRCIFKYFIKYLLSYLIFYIINNNLSYYLSKLPNTVNDMKYKLNAFMLTANNTSPEIITNYISLRLQQRYSLKWTLFPIFKDLDRKLKEGILFGYKLLCSGRFTKNQIASYEWKKQGLLPLNTITKPVRYSQARVRLKFGLGGLKLWLYTAYEHFSWKTMELIYPIYSPFKFSFCQKKSELTFSMNYWNYLYLKMFSFCTDYSLYDDYCMLVRIEISKLFAGLTKVFFLRNTLYSIFIKNNNKVVIKFENIAFESYSIDEILWEYIYDKNYKFETKIKEKFIKKYIC